MLESRQNLFRVGDTRSRENVHFGEIGHRKARRMFEDVVFGEVLFGERSVASFALRQTRESLHANSDAFWRLFKHEFRSEKIFFG